MVVPMPPVEGSCVPELFTTSVDSEPSFTTAVKVAVPEVTLPLKVFR